MVHSPPRSIRTVSTPRSVATDSPREPPSPTGPPLADNWRERLVQEVDASDADRIKSHIIRTTAILDEDLAKTRDIVSHFSELQAGVEESEQRLREEIEANAHLKRKNKALETAHAKRCAAHEREEQSHGITRSKLEEEARSHNHARDMLLSATAELDGLRNENDTLLAKLQALQEQLRVSRAEFMEMRAARVDLQMRHESLREAYERMQSERIEKSTHDSLRDEYEHLYKQQAEAKSMLKSALFTVDAYRKECHSIQGDLEVAKINVERHQADLTRVETENELLQEAKSWFERLLKQRAHAAMEKQLKFEDAKFMRDFFGEWRAIIRGMLMSRRRQEHGTARALRALAANGEALCAQCLIFWAQLAGSERSLRQRADRRLRTLAVLERQHFAQDMDLLRSSLGSWSQVAKMQAARRRQKEQRLAIAQRAVSMQQGRGMIFSAWAYRAAAGRLRRSMPAIAEKQLCARNALFQKKFFAAWVHVTALESVENKHSRRNLERAHRKAWGRVLRGWLATVRYLRQTDASRAKSMKMYQKILCSQDAEAKSVYFKAWQKDALNGKTRRLRKDRFIRGIFASMRMLQSQILATWAGHTVTAKNQKAIHRGVAQRFFMGSIAMLLAQCFKAWYSSTQAEKYQHLDQQLADALRQSTREAMGGQPPSIPMESLVFVAWSRFATWTKHQMLLQTCQQLQSDLDKAKSADKSLAEKEREVQNLEAELQGLMSLLNALSGRLLALGHTRALQIWSLRQDELRTFCFNAWVKEARELRAWRLKEAAKRGVEAMMGKRAYESDLALYQSCCEAWLLYTREARARSKLKERNLMQSLRVLAASESALVQKSFERWLAVVHDSKARLQRKLLNLTRIEQSLFAKEAMLVSRCFADWSAEVEAAKSAKRWKSHQENAVFVLMKQFQAQATVLLEKCVQAWKRVCEDEHTARKQREYGMKRLLCSICTTDQAVQAKWLAAWARAIEEVKRDKYFEATLSEKARQMEDCRLEARNHLKACGETCLLRMGAGANKQLKARCWYAWRLAWESANHKKFCNLKKYNAVASILRTIAAIEESFQTRCFLSWAWFVSDARCQKFLDEAEKTQTELEAATKRANENFAMSQHEAKELGAKLEELRKDHERIKGQLEAERGRCDGIVKSLRDREVQLQVLQAELEAALRAAKESLTPEEETKLRAELEILRRRCEDTSNQLATAKAELQAALMAAREAGEVSMLQRRCEDSNRELESQKRMCAETAKALQEREAELLRARADLEAAAGAGVDTAAAQEELDKLRSMVNDLQRVCNERNCLLEEQQKACAETEKALQEREAELSKAKADLEKALAAARAAGSSSAVIQDEVRQLRADLQKLQDKNKALQEEIGKSKDLALQLDRAKAELESALERESQLKREKSELESALRIAEDRERQFNREKADLELALKTAQEREAQLKASEADLQAALKAAQEAGSNTSRIAPAELQQLRDLADTLRMQLDEKSKRLESEQRASAEMMQALKEREAELSKVQAALDALQKEVSSLREQCDESARQLKDRQQELDSLKAEFEAAKAAEANGAASREELAKLRDDLQRSYDEVCAQLEAEKRSHAEAVQAFQQREAALRRAQAEELQQRDEELSLLRQKSDEANEELQSTRAKLEAAQQAAAKEAAEVELLRGQYEQKAHELEAQKRTCADLSAKLDAEQKLCAETLQALEACRADVARLEAELLQHSELSQRRKDANKELGMHCAHRAIDKLAHVSCEKCFSAWLRLTAAGRCDSLHALQKLNNIQHALRGIKANDETLRVGYFRSWVKAVASSRAMRAEQRMKELQDAADSALQGRNDSMAENAQLRREVAELRGERDSLEKNLRCAADENSQLVKANVEIEKNSVMANMERLAHKRDAAIFQKGRSMRHGTARVAALGRKITQVLLACWRAAVAYGKYEQMCQWKKQQTSKMLEKVFGTEAGLLVKLHFDAWCSFTNSAHARSDLKGQNMARTLSQIAHAERALLPRCFLMWSLAVLNGKCQAAAEAAEQARQEAEKTRKALLESKAKDSENLKQVKQLLEQLEAAKRQCMHLQQLLDSADAVALEAKELREEVGNLWRQRDNLKERLADAEERCIAAAQALQEKDKQLAVYHEQQQGAMLKAASRTSKARASIPPLEGSDPDPLLDKKPDDAEETESPEAEAPVLFQGTKTEPTGTQKAALFLRKQAYAARLRMVERLEQARKRECVVAWAHVVALSKKEQITEMKRQNALALLLKMCAAEDAALASRYVRAWRVTVDSISMQQQRKDQNMSRTLREIEALNQSLACCCFLVWRWMCDEAGHQQQEARLCQEAENAAKIAQHTCNHSDDEVKQLQAELEELTSERMTLVGNLKAEQARAANTTQVLQAQLAAYEKKIKSLKVAEEAQREDEKQTLRTQLETERQAEKQILRTQLETEMSKQLEELKKQREEERKKERQRASLAQEELQQQRDEELKREREHASARYQQLQQQREEELKREREHASATYQQLQQQREEELKREREHASAAQQALKLQQEEELKREREHAAAAYQELQQQRAEELKQERDHVAAAQRELQQREEELKKEREYQQELQQQREEELKRERELASAAQQQLRKHEEDLKLERERAAAAQQELQQHEEQLKLEREQALAAYQELQQQRDEEMKREREQVAAAQQKLQQHEEQLKREREQASTAFQELEQEREEELKRERDQVAAAQRELQQHEEEMKRERERASAAQLELQQQCEEELKRERDHASAVKQQLQEHEEELKQEREHASAAQQDLRQHEEQLRTEREQASTAIQELQQQREEELRLEREQIAAAYQQLQQHEEEMKQEREEELKQEREQASAAYQQLQQQREEELKQEREHALAAQQALKLQQEEELKREREQASAAYQELQHQREEELKREREHASAAYQELQQREQELRREREHTSAAQQKLQQREEEMKREREQASAAQQELQWQREEELKQEREHASAAYSELQKREEELKLEREHASTAYQELQKREEEMKRERDQASAAGQELQHRQEEELKREREHASAAYQELQKREEELKKEREHASAAHQELQQREEELKREREHASAAHQKLEQQHEEELEREREQVATACQEFQLHEEELKREREHATAAQQELQQREVELTSVLKNQQEAEIRKAQEFAQQAQRAVEVWQRKQSELEKRAQDLEEERQKSLLKLAEDNEELQRKQAEIEKSAQELEEALKTAAGDSVEQKRLEKEQERMKIELQQSKEEMKKSAEEAEIIKAQREAEIQKAAEQAKQAKQVVEEWQQKQSEMRKSVGEFEQVNRLTPKMRARSVLLKASDDGRLVKALQRKFDVDVEPEVQPDVKPRSKPEESTAAPKAWQELEPAFDDEESAVAEKALMALEAAFDLEESLIAEKALMALEAVLGEESAAADEESAAAEKALLALEAAFNMEESAIPEKARPERESVMFQQAEMMAELQFKKHSIHQMHGILVAWRQSCTAAKVASLHDELADLQDSQDQAREAIKASNISRVLARIQEEDQTLLSRCVLLWTDFIRAARCEKMFARVRSQLDSTVSRLMVEHAVACMRRCLKFWRLETEGSQMQLQWKDREKVRWFKSINALSKAFMFPFLFAWARETISTKFGSLEEDLRELKAVVATRDEDILEFQEVAKKSNTKVQEVWTQREEMKGRFQESEKLKDELQQIVNQLRSELDALQTQWSEAQDRLADGDAAVLEAKELREEVGHLWRQRDALKHQLEDAERRCAQGAQELILLQSQQRMPMPAAPHEAKKGSLSPDDASSKTVAQRGSMLQRGSAVAMRSFGSAAVFARGSMRMSAGTVQKVAQLAENVSNDKEQTEQTDFLKMQNLAQGLRIVERSEKVLKRDCIFAWTCTAAAWKHARKMEALKHQALGLLQRQLDWRTVFLAARCVRLWGRTVQKERAERRAQERSKCQVLDQIEAFNEPVKKVCFLSWAWVAADSKNQQEAQGRVQEATDAAQVLQESFTNKEREARQLRTEVERLSKQGIKLEASLKAEEIRASTTTKALQEQVAMYEQKLNMNAADMDESREQLRGTIKANNMARALVHVKEREWRLLSRYVILWKEATMSSTFDLLCGSLKLKLDRALEIHMAGEVAACTYRCLKLWRYVAAEAYKFRTRRDSKVKSTLDAVDVFEKQRHSHMFSVWAYVARCARVRALAQQLSETQEVVDVGKQDMSTLQDELKKVSTHYHEVWKQRDEMKARFKESEARNAELESLVKELQQHLEELMRQHLKELEQRAEEERKRLEELQKQLEEEENKRRQLQQQLTEEERTRAELLNQQLEEQRKRMEELQQLLEEERRRLEMLQQKRDEEKKQMEELKQQLEEERERAEKLQREWEEKRKRMEEQLQQLQVEMQPTPQLTVAKPSTGISRKCVDQLLLSYSETLQTWIFFWWKRVLSCAKYSRLEKDLASLESANQKREEAEKLQAEIARLQELYREEALRLRAAELRYEDLQRALKAREAQLRKACVDLSFTQRKARKDQMMERAVSKIDDQADRLRAQCFGAWIFAWEAARRIRARSNSTPSAANAPFEEPQMAERLIALVSRPRARGASTSMGFHADDATSSRGSPPPTPRPKDPRRRADCTRWQQLGSKPSGSTSHAPLSGRDSLDGSQTLSGSPIGDSEQTKLLPTAPAGPRSSAPRPQGTGRERVLGAASPTVALPALTPRNGNPTGAGEHRPFAELSGTVTVPRSSNQPIIGDRELSGTLEDLDTRKRILQQAITTTPRQRASLTGSTTPGLDDTRRSRSAMSQR